MLSLFQMCRNGFLVFCTATLFQIYLITLFPVIYRISKFTYIIPRLKEFLLKWFLSLAVVRSANKKQDNTFNHTKFYNMHT